MNWGNITNGISCGGKEIRTCEGSTGVCSPGSYTGVRYKWGGFTGLTSVTSYTDSCSPSYFYDEGLAVGKYAGDINCTGGGSCCAVGVDCSGFVSQSWGLSTKYSTTTLLNISTKLALNDDLLKGDILNRPGYHVLLCAENNPTGTINVYEASANDWKVSKRTYTFSEVANYDPCRYNNISFNYTVGQGTSGSELTAFQDAYNRAGGQSELGCPTNTVQTNGFTSFTGTAGHYQTFDNGVIEYIAYNPDPSCPYLGQAFAIVEPLHSKWVSFGFSIDNPLGYPTGDLSSTQTSSHGTSYKYQRFEGGV